MDIAELLKDSYKYIGGLITAYLAYRHYYFNKEIELFKEIVSIITEIQRELFNVEEIVLNVKKTQKKIENTCNQLKIESDKIFTDENIEKLTSSGYDIEELRNPFNDLDNICIKGAEASEQLETSWEEGRQMFKKHCNTHSELLESFVIKFISLSRVTILKEIWEDLNQDKMLLMSIKNDYQTNLLKMSSNLEHYSSSLDKLINIGNQLTENKTAKKV